MASTVTVEKNKERARVRVAIRAGAIGNFIEFYDFSLYGFFAVFIAGQFFPNLSPVAGLLAALGVNIGAFVMRPVGAFVFGYVADRLGRKRALVISVLLMSGATALIGMLPTYAAIGLAAPLLLLLCRLAQAMSAGGEQSNAWVLVMEHSPVERRGRSGTWLVTSVMMGVVFGILLSLLMTALLSQEAMTAWGWRVPFLISLPLGLVGLWLRMQLTDSDMFEAAAVAVHNAREQGKKSVAPIVQAWRGYKREMFVLFAWTALTSLFGYILIGFMASLLQQFEGYSQRDSLMLLSIGFLVAMPIVYWICQNSDRVSRKTFAIILAAGVVIWAIPAFWMAGQGPVGVAIALIGWATILYPQNIVAGFLVVELFPTDIRASAAAVPYQVGYAVFGGTAPYLGTWLTANVGPYVMGVYVVIVGLIVLLISIFGVPQARTMDVVSVEGETEPGGVPAVRPQ